MRKFTKKEVEILNRHAKWLRSEDGGERADLTRASLTGANLFEASLSRADLTGANLYGADLTEAELTGAKLTGADLTWAKLTEAKLTGAKFIPGWKIVKDE